MTTQSVAHTYIYEKGKRKFCSSCNVNYFVIKYIDSSKLYGELTFCESRFFLFNSIVRVGAESDALCGKVYLYRFFCHAFDNYLDRRHASSIECLCTHCKLEPGKSILSLAPAFDSSNMRYKSLRHSHDNDAYVNPFDRNSLCMHGNAFRNAYVKK